MKEIAGWRQRECGCTKYLTYRCVKSGNWSYTAIKQRKEDDV